jgi:probable phosphoglycerate mutase
MTRICFVRHGETDWNIETRLQGQMDLALNAEGERQAAALASRFAPGQATALYSSDLLRARQTAGPIAAALKLGMRLVPALRERHFGRCEGLTLEEILVRFEDDARAIERHDPDYAFPGQGESRRQHHERIVGCVSGLAKAHTGETIVVVTHGGVLDVIFREAQKLPLETPRNYPIPNAGINWISIQDGMWTIESWGDAEHLQMPRHDKSNGAVF